MSTMEQRKHLEKQLEKLISHFKSDRQRHKRLAVVLKALTVSLAGIVTVLLGWKEAPSVPISPFAGNIALILGATITVVSAYEAFFDPRILWVRETVVFARLTDLERDLTYAVAGAKDGEIEGEALGKFKARLDAILEESLTGWLRLRGQSDQAPPVPKVD